MTTKNRLAKLEQAQGTNEKLQYCCYSYADAKEYIARPFVGDGETFTFKASEAMTAYFDAHKEYEFLHVQIRRASEVMEAIK